MSKLDTPLTLAEGQAKRRIGIITQTGYGVRTVTAIIYEC